jgi:hypothetical protein
MDVDLQSLHKYFCFCQKSTAFWPAPPDHVQSDELLNKVTTSKSDFVPETKFAALVSSAFCVVFDNVIITLGAPDGFFLGAHLRAGIARG